MRMYNILYNTEYYILYEILVGTFHGRNYEYTRYYFVLYHLSYIISSVPEWLQHQTLSSDIADLAD